MSTIKANTLSNGTGTVAIRRSFNVSSITDNGTGITRLISRRRCRMRIIRLATAWLTTLAVQHLQTTRRFQLNKERLQLSTLRPLAVSIPSIPQAVVVAQMTWKSCGLTSSVNQEQS